MAIVEFVIESSDAAGARIRWLCNGQPLAQDIPLDAAAVRTLTTAGTDFAAWFEQGVRPYKEPAELRDIGTRLFDLAFRTAWPAVEAGLGPRPHTLLLRCREPGLLNLPWELVELSAGLPLGCDPGWAVLRVPLPGPTPVPAPPPGPVCLLFQVAAPTDQAQLDFEKEEDAMLAATGRLSRGVIVLPFAETGGIDELAGLVAEYGPHVVHLSGHGIVTDGVGHFAFEDERGRTDAQPVGEIVNRVFRGHPVRCVVLNACQSSQAVAAGLARKLVEAGDTRCPPARGRTRLGACARSVVVRRRSP